MDLQLSDEQTLLAETVAELVGRETADDGLAVAGSGERLWAALEEFGVVGGNADPDDEALGAVELTLVARALGERLAVVPFIATASVNYALGPAARGAVALAISEPSRRFSPVTPATRLDDGLLTGEKSHVTLAGTADVLAVTASTVDGPVVTLVRRDDPTLTVEDEATLDPSLRPGTVRFDATPTETARSDDAAGDVQRLSQTAAVLASAESVGAAAALLGIAVEYAGQRRQFDRPIASFQSLRHLLADLVVKIESSWSSVLYAAASLDERDADLVRTVSVTKAWASRSTLDVAHGCLQVFGGIAFTAEHPAHRFLRRIAALGSQYGSAADHERALGRLIANQLEVLT